MTEWGEWVAPTPLPGAPSIPPLHGETTPWLAEDCKIRPRLQHDARTGLWEATPIVYRNDPRGQLQTSARLAAWAKPRAGQDWYFAMTWLTTCLRRGYTHSLPRWRTAWLVYDRNLVQEVEPPRRYPSDYWRDQMSSALAEFAAQLSARHPEPLAPRPSATAMPRVRAEI